MNFGISAIKIRKTLNDSSGFINIVDYNRDRKFR